MFVMVSRIMGFQVYWFWYRTVLTFSTVRLVTVQVSRILSLLSWGISCSNYTSVAEMPRGPSSLCHGVLFDIWWRCQSVFFTFRHEWGWQERFQQRGDRGERRQHAQGDHGFLIACCVPLQRNQFIVVHSVGHFKNEKSGNIAVHSALKFSKSVEQSGSARLSLIRIKPLILAGKGDLASSIYSHWFWLGRET